MEVRAQANPRLDTTLTKRRDIYRPEYLAKDGRWYPCYTRFYKYTKRTATLKANQYKNDRCLPAFTNPTKAIDLRTDHGWEESPLGPTADELDSLPYTTVRTRKEILEEHAALGEYTVQTDMRSYRHFARGARIALQWVLSDPLNIQEPSTYLREGKA